MKQPQKRAQILLAVVLLLYACGYVTQFIGNYAVWQKNRRYAGRHFSAVSLFVAAGLSQRCSVVSLQSVLHGELRSSSRCDFPIPKAVQPGCPNGFRTQFRFLRKRHLRHVRLDAAAAVVPGGAAAVRITPTIPAARVRVPVFPAVHAPARVRAAAAPGAVPKTFIKLP